MEDRTLNLCEERCPMSLLKAKRFCAHMQDGERASILVTDKQSLRDMVRYFQTHSFSVQLEECDLISTLTVQKERQSPHV